MFASFKDAVEEKNGEQPWRAGPPGRPGGKERDVRGGARSRCQAGEKGRGNAGAGVWCEVLMSRSYDQEEGESKKW